MLTRLDLPIQDHLFVYRRKVCSMHRICLGFVVPATGTKEDGDVEKVIMVDLDL